MDFDDAYDALICPLKQCQLFKFLSYYEHSTFNEKYGLLLDNLATDVGWDHYYWWLKPFYSSLYFDTIIVFDVIQNLSSAWKFNAIN